LREFEHDLPICLGLWGHLWGNPAQFIAPAFDARCAVSGDHGDRNVPAVAQHPACYRRILDGIHVDDAAAVDDSNIATASAA